MFVIETVFIFEETIEYRYGALLEISDKFSTKSNIFKNDFAVLHCKFLILIMRKKNQLKTGKNLPVLSKSLLVTIART